MKRVHKNTITETILQMKLRGNSREKFHESQEGSNAQVHSDQMVLVKARQRGWTM
jgi:hypothetical protein